MRRRSKIKLVSQRRYWDQTFLTGVTDGGTGVGSIGVGVLLVELSAEIVIAEMSFAAQLT